METKITIIEGPPPVFEMVEDGWALGLNESPSLADMVFTRLRTFNGPSLVERCHRAWRERETMYLEFRGSDGLTQEVPIVAIRNVNADEGDTVFLWLRIEDEDVELEFDYEDDFDDEDDDFDLPDDLI
jgi:hypothetical protein